MEELTMATTMPKAVEVVLCLLQTTDPTGVPVIRSIDEYFGLDTLKLIVRQPLNLTDNMDKLDVICTVTGEIPLYNIMSRYAVNTRINQKSTHHRG